MGGLSAMHLPLCIPSITHTHFVTQKNEHPVGTSARLPLVSFEWEHLYFSLCHYPWTTWAVLHLNRAGSCLFHTEQVILLVSCSPWQFLLRWDVIFTLGKPSKKLVVWAAQWQKCPSDRCAALILITASASYSRYHCSFYSLVCFSLRLQLLLLISWLNNLHDPSFLLKDLFCPWWIRNCCRYWTYVTCTEITRLQFLLFLDSIFASGIKFIMKSQDTYFLASQLNFYPGLFTICS